MTCSKQKPTPGCYLLRAVACTGLRRGFRDTIFCWRCAPLDTPNASEQNPPHSASPARVVLLACVFVGVRMRVCVRGCALKCSRASTCRGCSLGTVAVSRASLCSLLERACVGLPTLHASGSWPFWSPAVQVGSLASLCFVGPRAALIVASPGAAQHVDFRPSRSELVQSRRVGAFSCMHARQTQAWS